MNQKVIRIILEAITATLTVMATPPMEDAPDTTPMAWKPTKEFVDEPTVTPSLSSVGEQKVFGTLPIPAGEAGALPLTPKVAAPVPGVKLDAEGLPWDDRIHGAGKTFMQSGSTKGTWKLKRGVNPVQVAQVKSELRAQYAAPAPAPAVPPAPLGAPIPPPAPAPASTLGGMTWVKLVELITRENIDPQAVINACNKFNQPDLDALNAVPVLIPLVAKELGVL